MLGGSVQSPLSNQSRQSRDVNAQNVMLQQLLDEANSKAQRYETLYLETRAKNLTLEDEMQGLANGSLSDEYSSTPLEMTIPTHNPSSSRHFIRLRGNLRAAQNEALVARRKHSELEIEAMKSASELAAARAQRESLLGGWQVYILDANCNSGSA